MSGPKFTADQVAALLAKLELAHQTGTVAASALRTNDGGLDDGEGVAAVLEQHVLGPVGEVISEIIGAGAADPE